MSLGCERFKYSKGLHKLGEGCYAWLQPDGSWGKSNAGLVASDDSALLVDTLYDQTLTAEMLAAMKELQPASKIKTVVNTHSNGDHCNGNSLLPDADIVSSVAAREGMQKESPQMMAQLLKQAPMMGAVGKYFVEAFGTYDFANVEQRLPTKTFTGELKVGVGKKDVQLIEVGPAHTEGDVLVYSPNDKVVFTGDILFIDGHPIMWAGPTANWLKACDKIISMDVEIVVPGHGPITDKKGVKEIKAYFEYLYGEAKTRFDKGMPIVEAALDIAAAHKYDWTISERLAVNVATMYREFAGDHSGANLMQLFGLMVQMHEHLQKQEATAK